MVETLLANKHPQALAKNISGRADTHQPTQESMANARLHIFFHPDCDAVTVQ